MDKVIFVLLGKTGSGKSTILDTILDMRGNDKLKKLTSYTSRPMRSGEKDGVEYKFLTNGEFDKMVEKNLIMEHRKYTQAQGELWQYGTGFPTSDYSITTMTPDVIDVVKSVPHVRVYPIYIEVDKDLRFKRMLQREENMKKPNYEEMCRRYASDEERYTQKVFEDAGVTEINTFNNNGFPFNTAMNVVLYINGIIKIYESRRRQEYANQ